MHTHTHTNTNTTIQIRYTRILLIYAAYIKKILTSYLDLLVDKARNEGIRLPLVTAARYQLSMNVHMTINLKLET